MEQSLITVGALLDVAGVPNIDDDDTGATYWRGDQFVSLAYADWQEEMELGPNDVVAVDGCPFKIDEIEIVPLIALHFTLLLNERRLERIWE